MKVAVIVCLALLVVAASASILPTDNDLTDKSIKCKLCKTVIEAVRKTLSIPALQGTITLSLKSICLALFPFDLETKLQCEKTIDDSISGIMDYIVNTLLKPEKVCFPLCP